MRETVDAVASSGRSAGSRTCPRGSGRRSRRGTMPGDQEERLKAIRSADNLAVIAGAGTGKTTLLVSKIVQKVVHEGVEIDRILALTFTEKAANEMRTKLREKLEEAGRAEGIDRAEIGTIHSFCAHVLREFPVEAGVTPGFEVR